MTRLLLHKMAWTTFHHRSSYACGECKKALCIYPCFKRFHTLTVYKAECTDALHSLPQVPVGSGGPRRTSSSKTRPKALDISSLEFYPYSVVAYIHRSLFTYLTMAVVVQKLNRMYNKLYVCQQTDHLSLSTTIFCRCQQTSSVVVNKLFNCRRSLN